MIRVLHLITGLNTGGAEMMLTKLVAGMDPAGFEPHVVTLLGEGPLAARVRAAGASVESLGLARGRVAPSAVWRLTRLLRRVRPDVVQTWLYHADLLGLVAARLARVGRVVWNLRCSNMDFAHSGRLTRYTVAACARLSSLPDAVVANSRVAVDVHRALGYRPRRVEVIPNGFDMHRFAPDPAARGSVRAELGVAPGAPLVGMVARFDPQKDHATFLRAARAVADARPDAQFVLLGDGVQADNPEMAALVRAAAPGLRPHLLGRRDDVARLAAALDVAVLSSAYGEGFPNVVGEAMACGVPCVVTDTGDSAAVVGGTGRVVPPRDAPALADAV
ncbi:glycosyltransferase, partial [Desulfocurvus sp.]|uniref:glycosyltransferase n=1 Tax=Desulfocurvus sp. TaxID=2871698 RepID=UPI0025BECACE